MEGIELPENSSILAIDALPFSAIGDHLVTIVASDSDPSTPSLNLRFEISIRERNLTPVWNLPSTLESSTDSISSWDLLTQSWVLDVNGDPLRFSLASGDDRPLPSGIRLDGTRVVVDPTTPAGSHALRLASSDGPDRPATEAFTTLVVHPAVVAPLPALRVAGALAVNEGQAFDLELLLDRPASADLAVNWSLHPTNGGSLDEAVVRSGLLRFAAGEQRGVLSLPTVDDAVLQGDRELELRFETNDNGVLLPSAPQRLLLQDDEAPDILLTSRWMKDQELELIYDPSADAGRGTGQELTLRDPSGGDLFSAVNITDVFVSGWLGEVQENSQLRLQWSDPLAASWPGLSAPVVLARLQFDRPDATSSPEIRIRGRAGEEQLLRWINSPWQAPPVQPLQEKLSAIASEAGASVQIEETLASAVSINADGEVTILDARALLERRYGLDPSLTLSSGGESIEPDLTSLMRRR